MDSLVKAGSGLTVMREDQTRIAEENGEIVVWESGRYYLPLRFGYLAEHGDEPLIKALRSAVSGIWPDTAQGASQAQAAP